MQRLETRVTMIIKTFTLKNAKKNLPIRKNSQNKTDAGKTLIIAGRKGFFGASVLSATAAARVGSGYTTVMTDLKNFPTVRHPDFLVLPIGIQSDIWKKFDSIAIGPGVGVNKMTEKIIRSLLKSNIQNVVLDADEITVIAQKKIFPLISTWVLTPHVGEMARLLNTTSAVINLDRATALQKVQLKYKCHILLKGHATLIQNSKSIFEITTGHKALAKAGTGDVLTGMIAGLLAQGCPALQAACLAATLHGMAAKKWVSSGRDYVSLMASDLLPLIPLVIKSLRILK